MNNKILLTVVTLLCVSSNIFTLRGRVAAFAVGTSVGRNNANQYYNPADQQIKRHEQEIKKLQRSIDQLEKSKKPNAAEQIQEKQRDIEKHEQHINELLR